MNKILLFVLLGLVGWLIESMVGQNQFVQIIGTEVSSLEMIMGIIGATVGCHLVTSNAAP